MSPLKKLGTPSERARKVLLGCGLIFLLIYIGKVPFGWAQDVGLYENYHIVFQIVFLQVEGFPFLRFLICKNYLNSQQSWEWERTTEYIAAWSRVQQKGRQSND